MLSNPDNVLNNYIIVLLIHKHTHTRTRTRITRTHVRTVCVAHTA